MDTVEKSLGFLNKFEGAVSLAEKARSMTVNNAQDHGAAGDLIAVIRDLEHELEAEYASHPVVLEARQLQKKKTELAKLLETARKTAKAAQIVWEDEQEKLRRAEESRLAAELKAKAEAEAIEAAREAEAAGDKDTAAEVLEQAIATPAPVVVIPRTAPATKGRRTITRFRIVDPKLIPREYLLPNETAIGGVVRAMGMAANIPGVEAYEVVC